MAGFKVLNTHCLHRNMGTTPQLSCAAARDSPDGNAHPGARAQGCAWSETTPGLAAVPPLKKVRERAGGTAPPHPVRGTTCECVCVNVHRHSRTTKHLGLLTEGGYQGVSFAGGTDKEGWEGLFHLSTLGFKVYCLDIQNKPE